MNYIEFAKNELKSIGYDLNEKEDSANKWIVENIFELLTVFSKQGHSGFSASYCVNIFSKLAKFQPLSPLTGKDEEWVEVDKGLYQNNRCSTVFKQNNKAYNIDGKVFREPNGCCFTNNDSKVFIEFPYTPSTEYINVPKSNEE